MAEEKTRRAVLTVKQLQDLFWNVAVTPGRTRGEERRIDAAEVKIGKLLDASISLDGNVIFGKEDFAERIECEFDDLEVYGCKLALVLAIAGDGMRKPRASHFRIKRFLLPMAKELGIEAIVAKESALPEEPEEKYSLEVKDSEPGKS